MNKKFLVAILTLLFLSCSHTPPPASNPRQERLAKFLQTQEQGTNVWAPNTPSEVLEAVSQFNQHKKLANGLTYGDSVRQLDLAGKTLEQIEPTMAIRKCKKVVDSLRDRSGKPAVCRGSSVTQVLFVCADGGLVRLKAEGDPCSKFRPQPHAVKAVRYPFNGDPKDFSKEAFKVGHEDRAIPKAPGMLAPAIDADGWAEDAHTDLAPLH